MDQRKFHYELQRRLRRRNAWPPFIGLSSPYKDLDFSRQAQWGLEEWRRYAEYLEKGGYRLRHKLEVSQREVNSLRHKLSRRKPGKWQPILGLMADADQRYKNRKRRGRKRSSRNQIADEMLAIQEQIKKEKGRCTNKDAMHEWRRQTDHPGGDDRNRLNAMSERRRCRAHNNSSR